MAPLTRRRKQQEEALAAAAPVIALADRLSALPSDVLPQILSFLPAHEALRTCVLARTWRNLWKEKRIFPTRLLITAAFEDPAVQEDVPGFVDRLLDLRLREIKDAPLESCEIRFGCCKPLASQNLTRLELANIAFREVDGGGEPDFSSCPVLEDMELVDCLLSAPMTSHSLKRLTVRRCKFWNCCRIRVPRLVSLRLETLTDRGPQLDSMPLLYDLRRCPTFHKLKTLILNDHWCKPVDCTPLACILEHAPVLEKLTIEFSQQVRCNYKMEMKGHLHATEDSTKISQHLKIVKIKCERVNETVLNVLNFMGTLNICKITTNAAFRFYISIW
ncbi:hypothetical protein SORBI_3005G078600 [Sorghum bicolor]|uniref:F-box domain-containing protein n=1 Tax=Sorghum bicolor TaxID=4558 RepID=A0A1Z5RHH4_SORBI|nr:hypothetical protein SORBI_3005G078600 [Sorghum bicolor]